MRCLIWQVADVQLSPLIETHFRAQMRTHHVTKEGETLHNYMRYSKLIFLSISQCNISRELKVSTQSPGQDTILEDRAVMLLPVQVIHPIDETSPLHGVEDTNLSSVMRELVVVMEAVVEPSGNTTQVMTSYMPDEIICGWKFDNCVEFDQRLLCFKVQTEKLNSIVQTNC